MDNSEITQRTERFVESEFRSEGSGHDWFHVDRVRKMALRIGESEGCDLFIVEIAALLHDLDDWKLADAESQTESKAKKWLVSVGIDVKEQLHILKIIDEVSFQGAGMETPVKSIEAAVVQDADRLDAIGAIGIARTFTYGGYKSRLIYDPSISPVMHNDFQEYKTSVAPTINHFYEKLLLLKDRMNTKTAKFIAEQRHRFMNDYLTQFYAEWEATR